MNSPVTANHRTVSHTLPPMSVWLGENAAYLCSCLLIAFWVAFPSVLNYGRSPPEILTTLALVGLASMLLYVRIGSFWRMGLVWLITLGPAVGLIVGLSPLTETQHNTSFRMTREGPPGGPGS